EFQVLVQKNLSFGQREKEKSFVWPNTRQRKEKRERKRKPSSLFLDLNLKKKQKRKGEREAKMCCIGCLARICMCIFCSAILTIAICLLFGLGPVKRFTIIKTSHFLDSCEPSMYGTLCRPGRPFFDMAPPSFLDQVAPSPF
ncbi:unnamed protein product, partial [Prunus brigantina]